MINLVGKYLDWEPDSVPKNFLIFLFKFIETPNCCGFASAFYTGYAFLTQESVHVSIKRFGFLNKSKFFFK